MSQATKTDCTVTATNAELGRHSGNGSNHRDAATGPHAVDRLTARLRQERVTRLALMLLDQWKNIHLKDLCIEGVDDRRRVCIAGRWLHNFGSDSFLGLDRDPAVHQAIATSLEHWGTHNGAPAPSTASSFVWKPSGGSPSGSAPKTR